MSTVHRLQGGERRVVVFSVAATARRHLRWLAERPHLLHVATSRARDHLVVLVDPDAALSEPALAPFAEHVSRDDRAGRASFGVEAEVRGARGG
ncbi:MAG: ATP-binding domain-containing protein [Myxococcales bacterium]|nr:ATP-binding domain-containing protein [Myxococcales bacterium]